MDGRMSCWSQTTAASLDCDCDWDGDVDCDVNFDCDFDLDLDCDAAWQPALGNIKSASKWRLPLFKSAKLKQNVARCCRLRLDALHTPLHITSLYLSLSPSPVGSSDCRLAVWFHSPDKPQGKCAAAARARRGRAKQAGKCQGATWSRLFPIHMMRKTASKCKCCTGNCPGSCYPFPHLCLPSCHSLYWFILSVNKHFNFNLCSPSFALLLLLLLP